MVLLPPPSPAAAPLHRDPILHFASGNKRQQARRPNQVPPKLKNLAPEEAHSMQVLRFKAPLEYRPLPKYILLDLLGKLHVDLMKTTIKGSLSIHSLLTSQPTDNFWKNSAKFFATK